MENMLTIQAKFDEYRKYTGLVEQFAKAQKGEVDAQKEKLGNQEREFDSKEQRVAILDDELARSKQQIEH